MCLRFPRARALDAIARDCRIVENRTSEIALSVAEGLDLTLVDDRALRSGDLDGQERDKNDRMHACYGRSAQRNNRLAAVGNRQDR